MSNPSRDVLAEHSSPIDEVEATSGEAIRFVPWNRLEGDPPSRRWFVKDWLPPAPTLLAGPGGLGKSLLIQSLCTALSIGRDFLGSVTTPRRCLLLSCEDDTNEAWRRQALINKQFGISMSDLDRLFMSPRVGRENVLIVETLHQIQMTGFFDLLKEQVNDLAIDVLVIDNIAHTYGANAVDAHRVTWFINQLHGMVRGRDFAPILIGHPSRKEDSEFAGSAAWENAVRMRWQLRDTPPDGKHASSTVGNGEVLYLARRKANYTELGYEALLRKDGLIVPLAESVDPVDLAAMKAAHERAVLDGLTEMMRMDMSASDSPCASNYLPKRLVSLRLNHQVTSDNLAEAMNRLLLEKRLIRRTIRRNGKEFKVLEAA